MRKRDCRRRRWRLTALHQGRHGEFELGKAQYSTPYFFDRLFVIRADWNPKSRQDPGLRGLTSRGGPLHYGMKSILKWTKFCPLLKMYLAWGNIFYPKRGQLIVECFFPKYPLHLVHIVFKAHYDLIAFPTALEYSVESPLYFWACSITINNSLKILLKHKCMEIRIECSFRNHLTQLCTNVARSLYSVSTTFWNFLAAQMVAFSTCIKPHMRSR